MNYEPNSRSIIDLFLTGHSEERIFSRFPRLKIKEDSKVYISYCESKIVPAAWVIPIHEGYLLGKWVQAKKGSYIKAIFIVQTAIYFWQFERSGFKKMKSVQVKIRKIISQGKI